MYHEDHILQYKGIGEGGEVGSNKKDGKERKNRYTVPARD